MRNFFIYFLLLIGVMTSCNKKPAVVDPQTTIDSVTISNFNSVLDEDFKAIKDSSEIAVFYESQIVLNKPVTADDSIEITSVMNVFQAGEYCYQVVHVGADVKTVKIHSWWLEDLAINPAKIITLDSALTRLNQADVKKPESNLITLRKPVGPTPLNPSYYVGSIKEGFVKVDAITSAVVPVE